MRYHVRRDVQSLQETGGKVAPGEIIVHRTGTLLLNCPKCGKVQFVAAKLEGSDQAPDIMKPIQCGAGYCNRCGVWFKIVTGRPIIVEEVPVVKQAEIPDVLKRAGVKRPPGQPV